MSRRKIGELNMPNITGHFTIYHDDEKQINPYTIYYTKRVWRDGYPYSSKRLVEKYGDFRSVMCHMHDIAFGNIYGRCFEGKEN